ncbi:MAG: hypothetical protein ACI85I_002128, partial [Arenicella sp.]
LKFVRLNELMTQKSVQCWQGNVLLSTYVPS